MQLITSYNTLLTLERCANACAHVHESSRVVSIWSVVCLISCVLYVIYAAPLDLLPHKPTLKDLNNKVVLRVAGRWMTVGLQLSIEDFVLQAIKTPNGSNEEHCCEMFRRWLAGEDGCGTLPRTWSSVLDAVENGCGSEVTREITETPP